MLLLMEGQYRAGAGAISPTILGHGSVSLLRAACGLCSKVTSLGWQVMHGPDMLEAML
jgi:hypothetical protein